MGAVVNETRNTTAMVEKFVGTSYEKLLVIYNNLESLLALQSQIENFNNTWLGSLSIVPTVRANGAPLEDGDRYFNKISKNTFIYNNGVWVNSNSVSTTVEVFTIGAGNLVGNNTVITLEGAYTPNTGNIMFFIEGVYQTPGIDYQETDEKTLTIVGEQLQIGEKVVVVLGSSLSTVNPLVSVIYGSYIVENQGQTLIQLPNGMLYVPGISNLEVYRNGIFQVIGIDYEETSAEYITMFSECDENDVITFRQGALVSTSETQKEFNVLALLNAFNSNEASLDISKPTLVKSGYTTGDGSGGVFIFNSVFSKNQANGVTVIDAGKSAGLQGTGIGNGCWIRQYEAEIHGPWFNSPYKGMALFKHLKGISNDRVNIKGFHENSTVGGGIFFYDPDMPATSHDGGTIISPLVTSTPGSAGWFVAPTEGSGCWVREDTSRPSVEWFGAYESAVDDSYNAFEAASNYTYPCEVPARTYTVSSTVNGQFYSFGAVTINGTVSTITNLLA